MSAAPANNLPLPIERRGALRRWRLQSGRISAGDGNVVECTIIDMSETGARVRLRSVCRLPAKFYLIDDRAAVAYKVRLVRSMGHEHGVELLHKFDLKQGSRLTTKISGK
jgi:hypothetical protein